MYQASKPLHANRRSGILEVWPQCFSRLIIQNFHLFLALDRYGGGIHIKPATVATPSSLPSLLKEPKSPPKISRNGAVNVTATRQNHHLPSIIASTHSLIPQLLQQIIMAKFEISDSKATQASLWLTVISTAICILELLHVFYAKGMEIWRCDFSKNCVFRLFLQRIFFFLQ